MYSHPNKLRRFSKKEYGIIETTTKDPFLDDKVRILESKSFRRLHGKAQVYCRNLDFINPNVRDRAVHTSEVIALSSKIANNLGLNVHLTEAIAAGHDIGHVPFGHLGEIIFSEYGKKEFRHNVFSVIVAQKIERKGKGLNLTFATLQGILAHSRGPKEMNLSNNVSEEANVVMIADKVAYTFSDINDAIRMGDLKKVPKELNLLGKSQREREYNIINSIIKESKRKGKVSFEDSKEAKMFKKIRDFMYKEFYFKQNRNEEKHILKTVIKFIEETIKTVNPLIVVSLMNDYEVQIIYREILKGKKELLQKAIKNKISSEKKSKKTKKMGLETQFGFLEIIPHLENKKMDLYDADLNEKEFKY